MTRLTRLIMLPSEPTDFERQYLARMNRVALLFFLLHPPVFALIAWVNGTRPELAVLLTAAVCVGPAVAYFTFKNPRWVSMVHGVTAMFMGGLLVHFGQGPVQIEMHFYFFSLIAMCAVFGNPLVIVAAAMTVVLHHVIVWVVLPRSVFNYEAAGWVVAVHAAFVVLESVAACFIARSFFDNVIGLEKIVQSRTEELVQINEDLTRAKVAAEAASVARAQFLASMSHEVRTPVSAILGLAELILDGSPNQAERLQAVTIRESGESLLSIINDILDFSKIEAGALRIEHRNFEVRKNLGSVISLLQGKADEKHIALRLGVLDEVPQFVRGDPLRLRQILINLVGNAIKFTATGEVEVRLGFQSQPPSGRLTFSVRDTGVGIPADKVGLLFQPFSQVDASTTRRFGGTGLGLVISRDLARLMGGDLAVQSEEGKGSVFLGSAQVGEASFDEQEAPVGLSFAAIAAAQATRLEVLLVEDNQILRAVGSEQLRRIGFAPDLACDGQEALTQIRRKRYDLVLLDVQMPVLDGLETARCIRREWPDPADRPVLVALTANAMVGYRETCLEAGMDDYLSKPLRMIQLKRVLDEVSQRAKQRGVASSGVESGEPTRADTPDVGALDRSVVRQLVEDVGVAATRECLSTFVGDAKDLMESMERALSAGEPKELARGAHTLKSTARTVGALRLGAMCEAIEIHPPSTAIPLKLLAVELSGVRKAIGVEFDRLSDP